MQNPKIKIVAIAKNEAAFLPQFIYHHFYFGADSIDIYINRTIDNSKNVLNKLKYKYPFLNYYEADWIDNIHCPPTIQHAVYSYAYDQSSEGYDYIFFLDIDEFFYSRKTGQSLQNCISGLDCPDQISFEWLAIDGRDKYKYPLFHQETYTGRLVNLGKSLVKTGLNLKKVNIHIQLSYDIQKSLLADGSPLKLNKHDYNFFRDSQLKGLKDYFIIHDWFKSPILHLSNIANGYALFNASVTGFKALKVNKKAYNGYNSPWLNVRFQASLPDSYHNGFSVLLDELHLQNDMEIALHLRRMLALEAVRQMKLLPDSIITKCSVKSLGSLDNIESALIKEISVYDPSFAALSGKNLLSPTSLISNEAETAANFRHAIKLYPYAQDQWKQPLFLKEFVRWLLSKGRFEEASTLVMDSSLESNRVFKNTWHLLLFARAYEKIGQMHLARKFFSRLLYLGDKETLEALQRLDFKP